MRFFFENVEKTDKFLNMLSKLSGEIVLKIFSRKKVNVTTSSPKMVFEIF